MPTPEHQEPENTSQEGWEYTSRISLLGDEAANSKKADNKATHPTTKKNTFREWLKKLMRRIADFLSKPKTWLEVAGLIVLTAYTHYAGQTVREIQRQTPTLINSASAATSAAKTAAHALQIGNRPWVKVSHRIIKPLDFTFVGAAGPAAVITFEDTMENVGQTPALHVLSWEDIITMDNNPPSDRTAVARQKEWCDANRNSDQTRTTGAILFPHSPAIQNSGAGALMSKINAAAVTSMIKGKVGFVMVGCIVYRSSFEPLDAPNHQTRFIYELGIPQSWGGWMPFIVPNGTATDLRLIPNFRTFTAD